VADSTDVRAIFFYRTKRVAVISFGIDRAPFLERMRAGESIPIPKGPIGIRATHLRIECGSETLYVMTVDHLADAAGKLYDVAFAPLVT
jgi:purine nucleoside permease